MEALIGFATAGLLLWLTLARPAYAVAMALCIPMIHPAIGSGASFLGPTAPAVLFCGAVIRAALRPGFPEQQRLTVLDISMLLWLAYLPSSALLGMGDHPEEAVEAALRLTYMGFSFYASVRLLCFSTGIGAFCRAFSTALLLFGVFIAVVALVRQEHASEFVSRLTIGKTYIALSIFITLALLDALFMLLFMNAHLARWERWFAIASVPLLFYGMLLCNTRGVVVALVLVCMLLLSRAIFSRRVSANVGRRATVGLITITGLLVGTAMAFPGVWAGMGSKFRDLSGVTGGTAPAGSSDEARLEVFAHALRRFAESPLLGHGIGSFGMETNSYPHNIYLEAMADMGLVGLGLIVVLTFGAVIVTMRYQSTNAFFINALVVFQLLESLVSLSLWMQKNLFVFIAMAVAHHLYQIAPDRSSTERSRARQALEPIGSR